MSQKWSSSRFGSRQTGFTAGISSRVPAFQPPSFYAAAAGLSPRTDSAQATERPPDEAQGQYTSAHGAPISYPTADAEADLMDEAEGSRRRKRSLSRSLSRALPKHHKEQETKSRDGNRWQMAEIPFLETQLLPSLRDTVDKMTHPPLQASQEQDCQQRTGRSHKENSSATPAEDVSRSLVVSPDQRLGRSPVSTGYSSTLASASRSYARSNPATPALSSEVNSPHLLGTPSLNVNRPDRSPSSKPASKIPGSSRMPTKSSLRVDPSLTPQMSSAPNTPLPDKVSSKSNRSTKNAIISSEAVQSPREASVSSSLPILRWKSLIYARHRRVEFGLPQSRRQARLNCRSQAPPKRVRSPARRVFSSSNTQTRRVHTRALPPAPTCPLRTALRTVAPSLNASTANVSWLGGSSSRTQRSYPARRRANGVRQAD